MEKSRSAQHSQNRNNSVKENPPKSAKKVACQMKEPPNILDEQLSKSKSVIKQKSNESKSQSEGRNFPFMLPISKSEFETIPR